MTFAIRLLLGVSLRTFSVRIALICSGEDRDPFWWRITHFPVMAIQPFTDCSGCKERRESQEVSHRTRSLIFPRAELLKRHFPGRERTDRFLSSRPLRLHGPILPELVWSVLEDLLASFLVRLEELAEAINGHLAILDVGGRLIDGQGEPPKSVHNS